ncbi:protein kinase [Nocardia sp. NPDC049149]|uniref:protein kinase domain-containing protein n=1 Tax=Nocardia sp. NPDC049149 TaxID=3364315 RepID=UPI00371634FC
MQLHPMHPAAWVLDQLTEWSWRVVELVSFTRSSTLVLAHRDGEQPVVIKAGFGSNHVLEALPDEQRPAAYGFYWYQQMTAVERGLAREDFRYERDLAVEVTGSNHVVPVLDTGTCSAFDWYAMPHYPGGNFRTSMLSAGTSATGVTHTEQISVLADVAAGLISLHQHGIVHRDVYQENILIDHGRGLITDLGAARRLSSPRGPHRRGPEVHWPPEYLTNYSGAGVEADVFSLGVLAYRVLFSDIPRAGDPPRPPAGYSVLTETVDAALAHRPADRPTMAQLHSALLRTAVAAAS